jgi:riboflavin kinase/FMN adenylyltransferase
MDVLDWDDFLARGGPAEKPLALTIGVFDGVHRGHRRLLERIVSAEGASATVITFRQNPARLFAPRAYPGDIFSLGQKLAAFEALGVGQTVLIDFSEQFSRQRGRDFIDQLVRRRPVRLFALGANFRCGYRLDTGVREIGAWTAPLGVETWVAEPVMEGGLPVSSSRVRRAIAAGAFEEAALLLGRPLDAVPPQLLV